MKKLTLKKGDIFLLYSDCLIEQKDKNGKEIGEEGLLQIIDNVPEDSSAADIIKILTDKFYKFAKGVEIDDDLTLIALIRK